MNIKTQKIIVKSLGLRQLTIGLLALAYGCGGDGVVSGTKIGVATGTRIAGTYQGKLYSTSDLSKSIGTAITTVSNDRRTITITTNNTSNGRNQIWTFVVGGTSNEITDGSVSGLDTNLYILNANINFLNRGVTGTLNYVEVDGSSSLTVSFDGAL